jgi:peptidyl-prolyl cis-trans isomerase D
LIGTIDPNSGQTLLSDTIARKRADSLAVVIQAGGDFKALAAQFSGDEGSKMKGGEYDFSSTQTNLAHEFYETIFYGKTGDKKVVKTQFGYHYIEVLGQKNFDEGLKVAYMAKPITTSKETDDSVSAAATQFAASSRDLKSFNENILKNRAYNKRLADDIKENDFSISSLGSSRSLVRWIFENKVGTVSDPFNIRDKYVVVAITRAKEEGIQAAADARNIVEPILRNQKKANEIIKKMGNPASLEALASANQNHVLKADSLSFGNPFIPQVGNEPRVVGVAFNKDMAGKIAPVAGNSGVFYVQSQLMGSRPAAGSDPEVQRRNMQMQLKQTASYSATQALHEAAKIEDNRREAGY